MNINFKEICRLCLRICEGYVDLNQTNGVKTLSDDIVEKIKYCYVLQIDLSEELPTKICYECIQVLSFFYTAKKNILISEQLLRDVVFVRRKLQEETKNYEEMITPDLTEVIQKKETNKSAVIPKTSVLEKSDQNNAAVIDVKLNYRKQSVITSCFRSTPLVDVETGKTISEIDNNHISFMEGHGSRQQEKKKIEYKAEGNSCIRKLPSTNYHLDNLLNLRDFKTEWDHQQEGKLRNMKVDESIQMFPRIIPPSTQLFHSKENVQGIGTKNDTGLPPYVKRSRRV